MADFARQRRLRFDTTGNQRRMPRFAHVAEEELALLLDEHGIRWQYEPTTFVLERDETGRVVEAVVPDFYLPDLDVYVECTVMKRSLLRRKRRKLRKLRERHGVIVTALERDDFHRLEERHGVKFSALTDSPTRTPAPAGEYCLRSGRRLE